MRISLRSVVLAAGCSVFAETLTWVVAKLADPASVVYRAAVAFHLPAETLRFFLFQGVENHPSFLDEIMMMGALFGVAALQWLCVLLVPFALFRLIMPKPAGGKAERS